MEALTRPKTTASASSVTAMPAASSLQAISMPGTRRPAARSATALTATRTRPITGGRLRSQQRSQGARPRGPRRAVVGAGRWARRRRSGQRPSRRGRRWASPRRPGSERARRRGARRPAGRGPGPASGRPRRRRRGRRSTPRMGVAASTRSTSARRVFEARARGTASDRRATNSAAPGVSSTPRSKRSPTMAMYSSRRAGMPSVGTPRRPAKYVAEGIVGGAEDGQLVRLGELHAVAAEEDASWRGATGRSVCTSRPSMSTTTPSKGPGRGSAGRAG